MFFLGFVFFAYLQDGLVVGDKLDITKNSLLLYLDMLNDLDTWGNMTTNSDQNSSLAQACHERKYTSTVYYRMLYFRFCPREDSNQSDANFEQFCSNLKSYHEDHIDSLRNTIKSEAVKNRVFGPGTESSELWLAYRTCQYVKDYFEQKEKLFSNTTDENDHVIRQPNYTEWFIHTVPFSLPVACGFTEEFYNQHAILSSSYCIPSSYRATLFFILVLDSIILVLTTIASVIILLATPKMKIASTPHGYMRMSLAVADLISGVIVCGVMNTTYTFYFKQHKFTEDGENSKSLDYHTQHYINGFGIVTVVSFSASIFTLVVISLDRFAAIHRPISYTLRIHTMKTFGVFMIITLWTVSIILAVAPVFRIDLIYTFTAIGLIIAPNLYIAYVACLGTSLILVWALNIALYLSVAQRPKVGESAAPNPSSASNISDHSSTSRTKKQRGSLASIATTLVTRYSNPTIETHNLKQDLNKKRINQRKRLELSLAVTVRLIVVTFTVALLPAMVVMGTGLLAPINPRSIRFNPVYKTIWSSFAYVASRMLFSNSLANCFIYNYRSSEFRKTVKTLLGRIVGHDLKTSK